MLVSTQGQQQGAILIQWNLATTGSVPSGMWDVHTSIGGFVGSNLQVAQCPVTASSTAINTNCIAAYMTMHVTPSAGGLYMENVSLLEPAPRERIQAYQNSAGYGLQTTIWMILQTRRLLYLTEGGSLLRVLLGHFGSLVPPSSTMSCTSINSPTLRTFMRALSRQKHRKYYIGPQIRRN